MMAVRAREQGVVVVGCLPANVAPTTVRLVSVTVMEKSIHMDGERSWRWGSLPRKRVAERIEVEVWLIRNRVRFRTELRGRCHH